jgi:hypothetical protein
LPGDTYLIRTVVVIAASGCSAAGRVPPVLVSC